MDSSFPPTTRQLVLALGQWLIASTLPYHQHHLQAARAALGPLLGQIATQADPTATAPTLRLLLTLLAEEAKIQGMD